ncbi:MAG: penicillin-binding protein 2 [Firmicutes bacterium]|nr:penicillin-binding protein 2 [Bacillota bacterium]
MSKEIDRRGFLLMMLYGLGTMAVVGQLGNLQFRKRDILAATAAAQHTQRLTEPAPRGEILDRNGVPLATNRPSNVVVIRYPYYNYRKNEEYRRSLELLADLTRVDLQELLERVDYKLETDMRFFDPVVVKADITQEEYAAIVANRDRLPGVDVVVRPVRQYPQKDLAAHVIGYVGEITREELEALAGQGYRGGDVIGKAGLERYYESYLRGTPGIRQVQIDYSFVPIGDLGWLKEPVPGANLILTLDVGLQALTERALDWQMLRIQNIYHVNDRKTYTEAKAGAAVVMDVRTGAILAMASRPSYDLNLWVPAISPEDYERLVNDPISPLWNRAVQGTYQPGSTWKMVTAAAALMEGVVTPREEVFCGGRYKETNQNCWNRWGHGRVDVARALRDSCNVYFYEMGRRLGIDRLVKWAQIFGFGSRTGVDLPEEEPGFLPTREWREARARDEGLEWYLGDTTSAAIGQTFQVTPVQLARYCAAIANGGTLLRPRLVERIVAADGTVLKSFGPEPQGELPVSREALAEIVRGMKMVNAPGGTSDFGRWPLPGIPTAGKTGTAEYPGSDNLGVYVCFAPADNPEVAVAVVIERAGHGGSVAPVARSILAGYFGVELPPEDPAFIPPEFPEKKEEIARALRSGRRWISRRSQGNGAVSD